jgi:threonine synthase
MAPVAPGWLERCSRCGRALRLEELRWCCACGGLLDFQPRPVDPIPEGRAMPGMWRYAAALPSVGDGRPGRVSLGEEATAAISVAPALWLKLEGSLPTGSFKARGAATMIGVAAGLGVNRVVVDSSGNAGAAVAAYSAAAGIGAEIFVPEATDPGKAAAIAGYGGDVLTVPGDRAETARAARARLSSGDAWYASHVYQPAFHHGVKTLAFELHEQIPGVDTGTVVVPAGNGTLVLGLWIGFRELQACGRVAGVPALVAVQAERCAPLAGLAPSGPTAATGIAISSPPRGGQVRAAVVASAGRVVTVDEAAIGRAMSSLARVGVEVEATAATAWAGMAVLDKAGIGLTPPTVIVVSGS